MERIHDLFLQAVKAALEDQAVSWGPEVSAQDYAQLLELAQHHHILPMFYEATYGCPGAAQIEPERRQACRRAVMQTVSAQSIQTLRFLELSGFLQKKGIHALVVKGLACRSLYPKPDHRASGDEDLLCPPDQLQACHDALLAFSMAPCGPDPEAYEVPYMLSDSSLYIELHRSLFDEDSPIFGPCNTLFENAFERSILLEAEGQSVPTLGPTDHMLYLLLHGFKHFLHSGFGIRQVCDMVLYANTYGKNIDWNHVVDQCHHLRATHFAVALFEIGRKYLTFDPTAACYPQAWQQIQVDEGPLLADLMAGGIYGSADRKRLHSSNMTLGAVGAHKEGKQATGIMGTLFPRASALENRFGYLKTKPWLLPVAWIQRFAGYAKETGFDKDTAARTVQTGKARIQLLKQYHIID